MIFNEDPRDEILRQSQRRLDANGKGGFAPRKDPDYFVMSKIKGRPAIMYGPFLKGEARDKAISLKRESPLTAITLLESKGEVNIEFSIH